MERRKAITTAAAASLTLLAGAAGIALNSGIVGAGGNDNVGQISPVNTTTNPPITVSVDDPATASPVTAAPAVQPTNSQPVTSSAASAYRQDGDHYGSGDDRYEHDSNTHDDYAGAHDDD